MGVWWLIQMAGTARSGGWQWPSVNGRAAGPCHRQPWRPPQVPWVSRYFLVSYRDVLRSASEKRRRRRGRRRQAKRPRAKGRLVGTFFLLSRRGWWASPRWFWLCCTSRRVPIGGLYAVRTTDVVRTSRSTYSSTVARWVLGMMGGWSAEWRLGVWSGSEGGGPLWREHRWIGGRERLRMNNAEGGEAIFTEGSPGLLFLLRSVRPRVFGQERNGYTRMPVAGYHDAMFQGDDVPGNVPDAADCWLLAAGAGGWATMPDTQAAGSETGAETMNWIDPVAHSRQPRN